MISAASNFFVPRGGAAAPAAAATVAPPTFDAPTVVPIPATGPVTLAASPSPSTLVAINAPPPTDPDEPIALPTVETGVIPVDGSTGTGVTATLPATGGGKARLKDGFSLPSILVVGNPAPTIATPPAAAPTVDPRIAPPPVPTGKAPRTADVPAIADAAPPIDAAPPASVAPPAPIVARPVVAPIAPDTRERPDEPADKPAPADEVAPPAAIVPVAPPPPTPAPIIPPASTPTVAVAIDATRKPDPAPVGAESPTRNAAPAARADAPGPAPPAAPALPPLPAPLVQAQHATPPAPAPAAPKPPVDAGTVAAQPGRIGQEMGVVIARHAATGGGEAITVRLDPADMGRIEVRLSFSDGGTLRAVVAAENPASLDLLRRDSADLNRALADAGVRADQQTLRFDDRSSGGGGGDSGANRAWQRWADPRGAASGPDHADADPIYRPLATSGRIDLMA